MPRPHDNIVTPLHAGEYMNLRQQKIMDLHIEGLTPAQIALQLQMSRSYVSDIMSAPNYKHMLAMRRARKSEMIDERAVNAEIDATNYLKQHALETAKNMVELANESENEAIRFRANKDILDRVGPQVRQKGGGDVNVGIMIDAEVVDNMKETMLMIEGKGGD